MGIIRFDMETCRFTHNSHFWEFSLKDYNELVDGWEIKIVRCSKGEQGWEEEINAIDRLSRGNAKMQRLLLRMNTI